MKKYECVKAFLVPLCDDDGFIIENEDKYIEEGSIWSTPKDENYRLIGAEVRLEKSDCERLEWLEITQEDLEDKFRLIEGV
ncbi:hypothetical protein PMX22_20765 [Clostridium butyricum]|jgi:hypothetical protein|uniref:hypothetical protein n=1 Tax=Clostridium butyricum TaxID=1492 RepID=UPI00206C0209|nr:hypothetical protein [Clostridium butyricum]MDB2162216.1 hypothetical protein [Clostridium butyricum]DAQ97595.1 MAG TPA: hypothetical protein [Caudoviricetes sp.]